MVTDFTVVVNTSNLGRVKAVRALCELYMRLATAAPIRPDPLQIQYATPQTPLIPYRQQRSNTHAPKESVPHMLNQISQTSAHALDLDRLGYVETIQPSKYPQTLSAIPSLSDVSWDTGRISPVQQISPREEISQPKIPEISDASLPLPVSTKSRKPSFLDKFRRSSSKQGNQSQPNLAPTLEKHQPQSESSGSLSWGSSRGSSDPMDFPSEQSNPKVKFNRQNDPIIDELTERVWGVDDRSIKDDRPHPSPGTSLSRRIKRRPTSDLEVAQTARRYTSDLEVPDPTPSSVLSQPSLTSKLILPSSENNYGGFCEGAWKLQVGERKGIKLRQGMGPVSTTYHFWQCTSKKCAFEGEMFGTVKSPTFDPRVRESKSGLRFKWMFLAKSHVAQARISHGQFSYRCIFCCTNNEPPPVFGRVDMLLDHLLTHRGQVLPAELLYRAGCVVDRLTADDENFDLNVPPFSGSDGQLIRLRGLGTSPSNTELPISIEPDDCNIANRFHGTNSENHWTN